MRFGRAASVTDHLDGHFRKMRSLAGRLVQFWSRGIDRLSDTEIGVGLGTSAHFIKLPVAQFVVEQLRLDGVRAHRFLL